MKLSEFDVAFAAYIGVMCAVILASLALLFVFLPLRDAHIYLPWEKQHAFVTMITQDMRKNPSQWEIDDLNSCSIKESGVRVCASNFPGFFVEIAEAQVRDGLNSHDRYALKQALQFQKRREESISVQKAAKLMGDK